MRWTEGSVYQGMWDFGYPYGMGKFVLSSGDSYEGRWLAPYAGITKSFTQSFLDHLTAGAKDGYSNTYSVWLNCKAEISKSNVLDGDDSQRGESINFIRETHQIHKKYTEKLKKMLDSAFSADFSKTHEKIMLETLTEYTGEWQQKKRAGLGHCVWANGDVYEGHWQNDMQNGYGRNLWDDGSIFTGCYLNHIKQGIGEYVWEDGTYYLGEWMNNLIEGVGYHIWPDGKKYLGEWKEGLMHGFGVLEYTTGKRYEGHWKDGKKHGKGYAITLFGETIKEFWNTGKKLSVHI